MTQPLPLLCAAHCDTSTSLIQGNFKPYCHVSLLSTCADMLFLSIRTKLRNCGWLQNAHRRVPTTPRPPSPRWARRTEMGFLPASQPVLLCRYRVPPTCTWLTVCPRTNQGGLCNIWPPTCTSSALSLCKWGAAPISSTHPPNHGLGHGMGVLVYQKSSVFNRY